MFANPTTPNAVDYLAFLYGVVGIPPANFPSVAGTATAGSNTTLTDSTQNWTANQWANYLMQDGNQVAVIASNAGSTLTWTSPLTNPVEPGDSYLVASQWLFTTLAVSLSTVNELLVGSPLYVLAIYNLAADRLLNYANDVPNQSYFRDARKDLRLATVSVGVPSAASDQGTATGILNPEFMKTMTLADLQTLRTPWGREYMGIALSVGTLWGLS